MCEDHSFAIIMVEGNCRTRNDVYLGENKIILGRVNVKSFYPPAPSLTNVSVPKTEQHPYFRGSRAIACAVDRVSAIFVLVMKMVLVVSSLCGKKCT